MEILRNLIDDFDLLCGVLNVAKIKTNFDPINQKIKCQGR
jgi:hypothetical protein